MTEKNWFDKLDVGDVFVEVYYSEVCFVWVKISPNETIIVYDWSPEYTDWAGNIDTRKYFLDRSDILPDDLDLNVPKQLKQWFEVK